MRRSRLGIFLSLAVCAALIWGVFNWQSLRDRMVLAGYQPDAEIAAIAKRTTMTSKAKTIFYVTKPILADRQTFGQQCPKREEGLNVLGCYHGGFLQSGKIILFRIESRELVDEIDVTAAHEMLHAAYERLSLVERKKIDDQLKAAVAKIPASQLTDVIKAYVREGNMNELHSHLGSEYQDLPPDLEQYYRRYFSNRQSIVAVHLGNEALFESCESDQKFQQSTLRSTKASIDSIKSQLQQMRSRMDRHLAAGETEQYNALVGPHNQLVEQHNSLVATFNSRVASFNSLVGRCNALSTSLDSDFQPIDTIKSR